MSTPKFKIIELTIEFFINMMYNTKCKEEKNHDNHDN
nr:MAG TPA: hypothetical protein [Caudoviricetes sp.]DAZ41992.1 MAG TPA: hypothetical protein [Caudoviricetes sp.]